MQCKGVLRDQGVVMQNFRGGWIIDVATGRTRQLSTRWIEIDAETDSVFVPRDHQLVELAHGTGEGRVLWRAKAPVATVRASGRWVAARSNDGQLVRIDRETGRIDPVTSWFGPYQVGPAGEVWHATDRWLWRWTEQGPSLLTTTAREIQSVGADGAPLLVQLDDGSLWVVSAGGTIRHIAGTTSRYLTVGTRELVVFAPSQDRITQYGLKSGERIHRLLMAEPLGAVLTADEQSMLVRSGPSSSVIYSDSVPAKLDDMKGWFDAATNARLDPKTDVLSWPVD